MDKQLDLVKILEKVPKGTKLYSPLYGEVTFTNIKSYSNYPIVVTDKFGSSHSFTIEGKYKDICEGECVLFPSKECRDWSEFRVDLPEFTSVMVSDDKKNWMLRFYYKNERAYNAGDKCGDTTSWRYIVPVDKFDCNNLTFNKEDNYGNADN